MPPRRVVVVASRMKTAALTRVAVASARARIDTARNAFVIFNRRELYAAPAPAILLTVNRSPIPELDDELRRRLRRRFGAAVDSWLDRLPPVLSDLRERWELEFDSLIQRGSISVVLRCDTATGRRAVLKISPNRKRISAEANALARWATVHVPVVLAVDEQVGALLLEAIEPGTSLADSKDYPRLESLIGLIVALHGDALPDAAYESVSDRIAYLYESGKKNYERRPDLAELIPRDLYDRGRRAAMRLAGDPTTTVVLHGDLTPVNVLDGGPERGLVAIDPAPCVGDPAFDAIDLALWRADNAETIVKRAGRLAPAVGSELRRLYQWCGAFAAMTALELAEASTDLHEPIGALIELAEEMT
jgi:streptomycin 6-kinase